MTENKNINFIEYLSQAYENMKSDFQKEIDFVFSKREEAMKELNEKGLPTVKHEEWKYTRVNFVKKYDFNIANADNEYPIEDIKLRANIDEDANNIVFINGFYSKELSNVVSNDDIQIFSLREELKNSSEEAYQAFVPELNYKENPFAAINTAIVKDGLVVKVAKNKIINDKIDVYYINYTENESIISNLKNYFFIDDNSFLNIEERFITLGDNASFTNIVNTGKIKDNAELKQIRVQNDTDNSHIITDTYFDQTRDSRYKYWGFSLNAAFIRNMINSKLADQGADSDIRGIFLPKNEEIMDNHIFVDHAMPKCTSNELFKGIMNDKSRGVFNGKILVREDAQQTNAYQTNHNILLSDNAKVDTKPQLEIYADDVKCSHGATSGNLDENSLFYLRARGIDPDTGRKLLLSAFVKEVIESVKDEKLEEELNLEIEKIIR